MTSFDPWVYVSCEQSSPQVINPVQGRTRPPSTSLSARYSPSWPLRVRLIFDTPSLVGFPLGIASRSTVTAFVSDPSLFCSQTGTAAFSGGNTPVIRRLAERFPPPFRSLSHE